MKIKDCMCDYIKYVTADSTVEDCAKMMNDNHIGCVLVCDKDKKLEGIVTDRDIVLRAVAKGKDACKTPVSDIMTTNVTSCDCSLDVEDAEELMTKEQVRRIPIIENDKVIGILTLGDLAINEEIDNCELCDTLEDICNCDDKNAE